MPGDFSGSHRQAQEAHVTVGARVGRAVAFGALVTGGALAAAGFATASASYLAISSILIGSSAVLRDFVGQRRGRITPMTVYAFSWTITSVANAVGLYNQSTDARRWYFLYAIDEHLLLAMQVSWFGLVLPLLAFTAVMRSPSLRDIGAALPRVRGELAERHLLVSALGLAAIGVLVSLTPALRSLGTLYALMAFLPHLAVFVLARLGAMHKRPVWIWIAFGIAAVLAIRAALFAYLRADVLSPIVAYTAGLLVGASSIRALRSLYIAPVYAFAALFVLYFAAFGEVRSRSPIGMERIEVVDQARLQSTEEAESYRTLITRLSNFNQLSQVGRVVKEDGWYNGETLEYLAYAWIPRAIWPDKPLIAKGAWFAHRIGQARQYNGRITNSINMTIPGELYLNFGWVGVLVGLLAYGTLLGLLWLTTDFWRRPHNVLGAAFGFYLIWTGLTGGADLQIAVTLIAVYLVFVGAGFFFKGFFGTRSATLAGYSRLSSGARSTAG